MSFEQVVRKARITCLNSAHRIEDHFVDITQMIESGAMPENLLPGESIKKGRTKKRSGQGR